jgi:hypothetical protein
LGRILVSVDVRARPGYLGTGVVGSNAWGLRQACRFRNFEMAMTGKGADAEHSILSRDE